MLNLVLLEPEIPQNTGNIARTCAATGARLHLIKPLGFEIDNAKLKRAGMDYWFHLEIFYYDGIDDFFEKNKDIEFYLFTKKASRLPNGFTAELCIRYSLTAFIKASARLVQGMT